jgi:hypothetical protein
MPVHMQELVSLFLGSGHARNDLERHWVDRVALKLKGQDFAEQRAEGAGIFLSDLLEVFLAALGCQRTQHGAAKLGCASKFVIPCD